MTNTRALIATALLVLIGGHPLRGDDKMTELEKLLKKLNQETDAFRKRAAKLEARQKKLQQKLAGFEKEFPRGTWHPPLPRIDPPELPELPADLRGKVTDGADDLLIIDIGIDVGLALGSVLGVYRVNGADSHYLGTVRVTDPYNLYPKAAVVKFTPVRKVPLKDLKPEELPKKGDLVRPMKPKD